METEIQKENEEKKEYLKSYRRAVKREKDILDEIQRLRADKMFPSVANDGMPKGSSQSDLSDYIAILDEQIELLKAERLEKAQAAAESWRVGSAPAFGYRALRLETAGREDSKRCKTKPDAPSVPHKRPISRTSRKFPHKIKR